jgi:SAM-dependent methyltransferase
VPIDYKDTSTQVSQRETFRRNFLARTYRNYVERRIQRELRAPPAILDVGCGEGILLENLRTAYPGKRLAGIDLSEENVRICRELGLDVAFGDACSLPFDAGSFDACVMMSVLEHVEGPRDALREARRVLRPGGLLVVLLPNDDFFRFARYLFLRFREARLDYGHVSHWDPAHTRQELETAGFEVTARYNIPGHLWALSLHHLCVGTKAG